jgi:hypothetical protein
MIINVPFEVLMEAVSNRATQNPHSQHLRPLEFLSVESTVQSDHCVASAAAARMQHRVAQQQTHAVDAHVLLALAAPSTSCAWKSMFCRQF